MDTDIVLVGAEGAAQINARYGSEPSVTFYTHISDRFAPFHTKVINTMCAMRRTQNSGQTFAYHRPLSILIQPILVELDIVDNLILDCRL
jgi:hypothetical protein